MFLGGYTDIIGRNHMKYITNMIRHIIDHMNIYGDEHIYASKVSHMSGIPFWNGKEKRTLILVDGTPQYILVYYAEENIDVPSSHYRDYDVVLQAGEGIYSPSRGNLCIVKEYEVCNTVGIIKKLNTLTSDDINVLKMFEAYVSPPKVDKGVKIKIKEQSTALYDNTYHSDDTIEYYHLKNGNLQILEEWEYDNLQVKKTFHSEDFDYSGGPGSYHDTKSNIHPKLRTYLKKVCSSVINDNDTGKYGGKRSYPKIKARAKRKWEEQGKKDAKYVSTCSKSFDLYTKDPNGAFHKLFRWNIEKMPTEHLYYTMASIGEGSWFYTPNIEFKDGDEYIINDILFTYNSNEECPFTYYDK